MYGLLRARLPSPLPEAIMALWYVGLLVLILLCSQIPDLPFRYLGF